MYAGAYCMLIYDFEITFCERFRIVGASPSRPPPPFFPSAPDGLSVYYGTATVAAVFTTTIKKHTTKPIYGHVCRKNASVHICE